MFFLVLEYKGCISIYTLALNRDGMPPLSIIHTLLLIMHVVKKLFYDQVISLI